LRRSDGPGFHGAIEAWQDGATGSGEIIAVIDSGIDSDSPEFAGRIHPDSRDVAGNRGVDPEDDHGTNVSLVAAGARNDEGVLGIAFDAQVLAIRADTPGSCGSDTPQDPTLGCTFSDANIAAGVDLAISTGASVINLSLGGSNATSQLRNAVGRAAAAGIVVVISAGNGGDGSEPGIDPDQPDPFATSLLEAGGGNVIIVGSIDEDGAFSDFSNRAGNSAASFISARGERICCVYDNGEIFVETIDGEQFVTLFSGTSFAAPQVAGAVALLAQAFPNLTGEEIVEILLTTARDAGASGTDNVFGSGILDIARAFQPQGTTTLAGTRSALALVDDFAIGSAAMGDALSGAAISTIITDRYDRAYTVDLSGQTRNAAQVQRLQGAVGRGGLTRAAGNAALSLAITIGEGPRAAGLGWSEALQLTPDDALGARVLAARVAARIAPDMQVGFAVSQSANGLVAQLQGAERPAFLIAPEAGRGDAGFLDSSEIAFATRHEVGRWGFTVSAERGRAWLGDNRRASDIMFGVRERRPTSTFSIAADRSWNGLDASAAISLLSEEGTLLGAHFNPAFGLVGADTVFMDGQLAYSLDRKWRIGAAYRAGFSSPRGGALIGSGSQVETRAWSFDLTRRGNFLTRDSIGLRLSQPVRVTGGAIRFDMPVGYDYATESAIFGRQILSLAPEGREVMGELNWSARLPFGYVSTSAFYRSEPGHFQHAPDDVGALITLSSAF
jgi:subtilisin family serine protease